MRFDFDAVLLAGRPVAGAAPGPVLGLFGETAGHWIVVDVVDLLDEFILREDIEVVVPGLPELGPVAFEKFRCLSLENTHGGSERVDLWFTEEKMNMLGHEYVAEEKETVTAAELFERFLKEDAGAVAIQIRETPVTTEGDEVVVAFGLITLQMARHGSIVVSRRSDPTHATPPMRKKRA